MESSAHLITCSSHHAPSLHARKQYPRTHNETNSANKYFVRLLRVAEQRCAAEVRGYGLRKFYEIDPPRLLRCWHYFLVAQAHRNGLNFMSNLGKDIRIAARIFGCACGGIRKQTSIALEKERDGRGLPCLCTTLERIQQQHNHKRTR
jgi:hypothetical protein